VRVEGDPRFGARNQLGSPWLGVVRAGRAAP
jgi:hypothetical protein